MKYYILDTSVLIYDPDAIYSFEENKVIIPFTVLEELDGLKLRTDNVGFSARRAIRNIDKSLSDLLILPCPDSVTKDDSILKASMVFKEEPKVFVTKDISLKIRAIAYGLKVEDYKTVMVLDSPILNGEYIIEDYVIAEALAKDEEVKVDFPENSYLVYKGNSWSFLVYVDGNSCLNKFYNADTVFGLRLRNVKQKFLANAILRDDIEVVFTIGRAGTGKTLISLAASLDLVLEQQKFDKIVIVKPVVPVDSGIGFLPGDQSEKMFPWIQPIYDNLKVMFKANEYNSEVVSSVIEVQPLSFIRGRSFNNSILLIEEAQNMTPREIKTVMSRVGENSKLILGGDIEQIDVPFLSKYDNGLIVAANRFLESAEARKSSAIITLDKTERGHIADLASLL